MTTENLHAIPENPADKFLSQMLEGYENGLTGISKYIDDTQKQLDAAIERKKEMEDAVVELKQILGIQEETGTPTLPF